MMKRILSVLIAAVVILSMNCFLLPVNAAESVEYTTADDGFSARGTNSFGTMFANAISQVQQEQSESNGYIIYSIEMLGNTAIVDFQAQDICTLVVGVYDEAGEELLGMGHVLVTSDSSQINVDIEIDNMPQYFYLRGFLTDSETLRPNSTVYESPMYTREMQDFLSKTTDNFDPDRVLNLDGSKDNNFAVYSDDVKIISVDDKRNIITKIDRENNTYTFENADSDIAQLNNGDIFSCTYDDEVIIVKVASVNVDGTTVTVVGAETELEDVFEYLKIEETPDTEAFDVSDVSEGITYTGVVKENEELFNVQNDTENVPYSSRISIETGLSKKHSFKLDDAKLGKVEINGSVTFGISGKLKAYISRSESYIELRVDYSITPDVHISGKADGKLKICSFGFSPFLGVYIDFTPSIIVKVNATIQAKASISGTIGVKMGTNGFENLTGIPTIQTDCDFEGSVYVGFSFEPKVKIISDDIAFIKLTAELGGTLKGKIEVPSEMANEKAWHTCQRCIDGDIIGSAKISMVGSIWNDEDMTFTATLININEKLCDFYYSFDQKTGGFTECPYWKSRVTIRVTDNQGSPLSGAKVRYGTVDKDKFTPSLILGMKFNNLADIYEATFTPIKEITTTQKGEYMIMVNNNDFENGIFIAEGVMEGYKSQKFACALSNKESILTVVMEPDGTVKKTTGISDGSNKTAKEKPILAKKVIVGDYNTAIITTDGVLYTSGWHTYHVVSDSGSTRYENSSTVPLKIAENVIDAVEVHSGMGAVTSDNILHTWGQDATFGPDDDPYFLSVGINGGWMKNLSLAKAPLSNVRSITRNGILLAVVTTSDELYLCGTIGLFSKLKYGYDPNYDGKYNSYGKFFEKVMDNVSEVSIGGDNIAVVTKSGDLYTWGDFPLGDGTRENRSVPTKIMDNVVSVSLGNDHGAAVTNNGELYMWGNNDCHALGIEYPSSGSSYYTTPIKVMDNIALVSLGSSNSVAVTKKGDLYVWGANYYGQLGDGSTTIIEKPKKIMDNVSSVSFNGFTCAAIKSDGSVWIWGHNYYGQFGNGTTIDSLVPIKFVIPQKTEPTGLVFSVPAGYTYNGNSKYILYDSDNTVTVSDQRAAATTQQAAFTDLIPNSVYNFYALCSDTVSDPLAKENVLYITQCVSDSSGELTVNYPSDVDVSDSIVFVKGMERIDISNADVYTFPRYVDGTEIFAAPMVYYDDILLTLGKDYTIDGIVSSETPGKYAITLSGRGDFTGSQNVQWELLSLNGESDTENPHAHSGGKATCVMQAVCTICGQEYGAVDSTNHVNTIIQNAKAATATEDGYTGDTVCKDCGNIERGTVIPKTSSDPSDGNGDDTSDSTPSTPVAPSEPSDSSGNTTSDDTKPNTSSGENAETSSGNDSADSTTNSTGGSSSSGDSSNNGYTSNESPNPSTGVTLAVIPVLLAAGLAAVIAKNKKR